MTKKLLRSILSPKAGDVWQNGLETLVVTSVDSENVILVNNKTAMTLTYPAYVLRAMRTISRRAKITFVPAPGPRTFLYLRDTSKITDATPEQTKLWEERA